MLCGRKEVRVGVIWKVISDGKNDIFDLHELKNGVNRVYEVDLNVDFEHLEST